MKQEFSLKVEGKEWVNLQDAAFEKVNNTCFGLVIRLLISSGSDKIWTISG